jgi:hypothetical protein
MPIMTHWNSREYWSLAHDADVSRVSGYDDRGLEHWQIIMAGRGMKARQDEAILLIMDHIEQGNEPGEVS